MTDGEFVRANRVPRARTLRRAPGLDPGRIRRALPLGTLRDWEQGRSESDQPARAYLTVIAHDPDGVRHAFERARRGRGMG